jgi:hypothetical protein|tara:strand:- start:458 stop:1450 length:993 start_codon:yes stop_codon:yes gene_type:complete
MKMNSLKAAAAFGLSALVVSSAAAQTASKPVGYETVAINQQFNTFGLRLLGAPNVTSTVGAVSGTTVTLDAAPSADGTYIVEVNDNALAGAVVTGTSTGADVVLSEDLSAGLAVGDSITLRATQTMASVFGTDSTLTGAASEGAADLVSVPDGSGGFSTYWYFTGSFGGAGKGWRESGQVAGTIDPASITLVYTDGMVVTNRGADNSLVITGSVKTAPTTLGLTTQFNYVSSVYPAGSTLDNSGLESQLTAAASEGAADLVSLPDGAGGFSTYWHFSGGFGGAGAGWRESGQVAGTIDAALVDLTSGMIVTNRGDAQNADIVAPSFYADL